MSKSLWSLGEPVFFSALLQFRRLIPLPKSAEIQQPAFMVRHVFEEAEESANQRGAGDDSEKVIVFVNGKEPLGTIAEFPDHLNNTGVGGDPELPWEQVGGDSIGGESLVDGFEQGIGARLPGEFADWIMFSRIDHRGAADTVFDEKSGCVGKDHVGGDGHHPRQHHVTR